MPETRTLIVTMSEESWKVFDVYKRLLQMKASRKGATISRQNSPIVGAILIYFLRRHGEEIINAYTEAIARRKKKKEVKMGGMDLVIPDKRPAYPVPDSPTHWNSIRRATRGESHWAALRAGKKAKKLKSIPEPSGE